MNIDELIELAKKNKNRDTKGFVERQKKREKEYSKLKKEINLNFTYTI